MPQQESERKNFIARNESFTCEHCDKQISEAQKTYRNHCPYCLYSKHVDEFVPGDRAATCNSLMQPTQIMQKKGEFIIVHQCITCGKKINNKAAIDDSIDALVEIIQNSSR